MGGDDDVVGGRGGGGGGGEGMQISVCRGKLAVMKFVAGLAGLTSIY